MIGIDNDDREELTVEYNLDEHIKWVYKFPLVIADYAPNITLLEKYDGVTVATSDYTIVGKVDDVNAKITAEGCEVTQNDDGTFSIKAELEDGKNTIVIEAENKIGKTSKSVVNLYLDNSGSVIEKNSIIDKYLPLIITLSLSCVLIVAIIVLTKKKGQKNEIEEDK